MGHTATVTSKGQITIPIETRKRLGLQAGDKVDFVVEGGRTVVKPVRAEENPFAQDIGIAPGFGSMAEVNAWVREMRDDDESSL